MPVIVIKVGTSTLAREDGLDGLALWRLAGTVAELHRLGWKSVIVSSGAVGLGRARLGWADRPREIALKQAAAAVGQGLLMNAWETMLAPLGLTTAQLLLTRADLADRQRYLNASTTLRTLLDQDRPVVPVINENDSVAVDELKFGDNDTLSALVAQLVDAEWLAILTDVAGLYDRNPHTDPAARLIPEVAEWTADLEAIAGGSQSSLGTGGMTTKLAAARLATAAGIPVALALGSRPHQLAALLASETRDAFEGTIFRARRADRLEFRRRWLAFGSPTRGAFRLDEGAARAIGREGRSLLPAGVREVAGEFLAGETVSILDAAGREIARGLASYGSVEARKILGLQSGAIEQALGYKLSDELIHRDNLVRV
jgi:glutamate 5-kinase